MATPNTTITRTDLTMAFEEFDLAAMRRKLVGTRIFRPLGVGVQAADVGKIPIEALLIAPDTTRAPSGGFRRSDFEFSKYSYACVQRGFEEVMDDWTVKVYRDLIDAEAIHAQRAIDAVLRAIEVDIAAKIYDTTTWTGAALTTAITNEWDDATNATPKADIDAARIKIMDATGGYEPNTLICNWKQMNGALQADDTVDRLKYSGRDDPKAFNAETLAALFDLDQVLVANAYKQAAKEGQDSDADVIWGDEYMMLCRVAMSSDPREPCIGRMFVWTDDAPVPGGDGEAAVVIDQYREENVTGDVFRARTNRDLVVMYPEMGHLFSNAITI